MGSGGGGAVAHAHSNSHAFAGNWSKTYIEIYNSYIYTTGDRDTALPYPLTDNFIWIEPLLGSQ
jgi:hypothetical protein